MKNPPSTEVSLLGGSYRYIFFYEKRSTVIKAQMFTVPVSVIHLFTDWRNRINFQYHTVNGRNGQTWFTSINSDPSLSDKTVFVHKL